MVDIFRLENNVPDIYVSESRDFQLLCRLFDSIHTGVRFDIDGIEYASNPKIVRTTLLSLLAGKVGYFPKSITNGRLLRYVVAAFPYLLKNKGTIEGISAAIQVFLKGMQINKQVGVIINNKDNYKIIIELSLGVKDISILNDILSYVIPTGYIIDYVDTIDWRGLSNIKTSDSVKVLYINNVANSQTKGHTDLFNPYTCDTIKPLSPSCEGFNKDIYNWAATVENAEILSAYEVAHNSMHYLCDPKKEVLPSE